MTTIRPGIRLLALALLAALAACEPSGEEMGTLTGPMPQAPPATVVRDETTRLAVFTRGNSVGHADWARIDRFLAGAGGTRPEIARLAITGATSSTADLIAERALALGYDDNNIVTTPEPRFSRARIELTVRRAAAVLPNCPQTSHLNLIDGDNRVSSDWGCSTVSAYGLQVADPHDLVRGRSGGETDSIMTTAAIHRLQTDKLKKLDTTTSTTAVKGGGGSQ